MWITANTKEAIQRATHTDQNCLENEGFRQLNSDHEIAMLCSISTSLQTIQFRHVILIAFNPTRQRAWRDPAARRGCRSLTVRVFRSVKN